MEIKKEPIYLGIELNDTYAMISYYQRNMKEPVTVSTIAGSTMYQIPTLLAKRRNMGQWFYGEDAGNMAKNAEAVCVDALLKRAVNGETIQMENESYEAWELLAFYLKKLMDLPLKLGNLPRIDKVILTVDRLYKENMQVFWKIAPKLGLAKDQFMVVSYKECFYYFTLNQNPELWIHDVYLFTCEENSLYYYGLKCNTRTIPQVVTIKESVRYPLDEDKDAEFLAILQKAFERQAVSTAFLVGNGFDNAWLKESLNFLCKYRRVFMGNNLYCKGACYAGYVRDHEESWNYVYMGENEMKFNLSLKVKNRGTESLHTLIRAGKNWFETTGDCEVILAGTPEIDFWKQLPNSREAVVETLELTDLPKRPERTTRLRITAIPLSDTEIEVQIRDLGFGEIYRATDKIWKYKMKM